MNLSEINTNCIEGRLLIAALSSLTVSPVINLNEKELDGRQMHLDEVLNECLEVANFIYKDNPLPEAEVAQPKTFLHELQSLINRSSKETENDTPAYILANFLNNALRNYTDTVKARDTWFGVSMWDKNATEAKWIS